ncbi:hypothetical protein ACHAXT_010814 [Thalassiosira profunda]
MKCPLHLALAAAVAIAPASPAADNAGWTYLEPLYACSPTNSNARFGNCNLATHECLANPNHPQATTDDACVACAKDQKYWPCDVDGLCYCWEEGTSKIPPAPSTRSYNGGEGLNISAIDPCDILTEEVFKTIAPMAQHPYSYEGFCTAVREYNKNHPDEGAFNMGTREQQKNELAAFFGNVLHESDDLKAGREYLMCADKQEVAGEVYCKPCDVSTFDWETMTCPVSLASEGRAFNNYCQSNLLPPEGCECDDVYERMDKGPMAGYVKANEVYFGRGAIQLTWNYNVIKASVALTGASQTFCQRPDLIATVEEYAWGAGLFFWMENVKNDRTCHQAVLLNEDFGQTLDTINGGLECPADSHGWHGKAIQLRLNRYCKAASAIGVERLLSLDACMDMNKRMAQCLSEGSCDECKVWKESWNATWTAQLADPAENTEGEGEAQHAGKDKDKNPNKQNGGNGCNQQGVDQKMAKELQKLQKQAEEQGVTLEELVADLGIELDPCLFEEKPNASGSQEKEEINAKDQEKEEPKADATAVASPTPPTAGDAPSPSSGGQGGAVVSSNEPASAANDGPQETRSPTPPPTQKAGPPSALAFTMTHSKGQDAQQSEVTGPAPDNASPVSSPDVSNGNGNEGPSASQFDGMTNWAMTPLNPPSASPVMAPKKEAEAIADAHNVVPTKTPPPTHMPTKLPTQMPVKVVNIADAHPSFKEPTQQTPTAETASEPNASPESYPNKISSTMYEFSPLDDVTISRTQSDQNFGSSPSLSVDMLEGDVSLFRFDLSIIGDGVIQSAVLMLTPKEEDGASGGGVYYIQPVVNGWTEDGVTYDTAPKAEGSLFASVASRNDDGGYELDVTKAAANQVISFRLVGTDRVRTEFASSEASDPTTAPVLIVTLESIDDASVVESPKEEANEAEASSSGATSNAKGQSSGGKDKPTGANASSGQSSNAASYPEAPNSSSLGRFFGHIWLDRNADGLQDSTEPGLRGILVDLYKCDGDVWLEGTRTAAGGDYIFEELEEGRYYVDVTAGADLGFSAKGAATERSVKNSDVDQSTGKSDCMELSSLGSLSVTVNAGIVKPAPESPSSATKAPATPGSSFSDSSAQEAVDKDSPDYNCRGRACTEGPEYCRSRYNFCGTGEEYCDEDSMWTSECGTPSPTLRPSLEPTSGMPTFVHDPDIHCSGDPCVVGEEGDGTWCRSEIGYCGSGSLYCNPESVWIPECDPGSKGGDSSLADVAASFAAGDLSTTNGTDSQTSKDGQDFPIEMPTFAPTRDDEEFSSFALPTLSQITMPKPTDVSASKNDHGSGAQSKSVQSDDDSASTAASQTENSNADSEPAPANQDNAPGEAWYIKYGDLQPIRRNDSLQSQIPTRILAFTSAMAGWWACRQSL